MSDLLLILEAIGVGLVGCAVVWLLLMAGYGLLTYARRMFP